MNNHKKSTCLDSIGFVSDMARMARGAGRDSMADIYEIRRQEEAKFRMRHGAAANG